MAAYDLLTPPEATAALRLTTDQQAPLVASMVSGISDSIRTLCGPVISETVTTELHHGGYSWLRLNHVPALSITTVVETAGTTATTLTGSDYLLESAGSLVGKLHRRADSTQSTWASGTFNISVTYQAGRYASRALTEERWKAGCRSILIQQWQWESSQWSRNPQGDEFRPDGPFDVDTAVKAKFPRDLLPSGAA